MPRHFLKNINLQQLRYFIAAIECGSFRKTAIMLGAQESAISRRIRDLEDQLGASLFQRHASGVYLTLAGQRFLRRIRIALQQIDDGARDVAAIGRSEQGNIKVGIFSALSSGFLFDLLQTYSKDYPRVWVEIVEANPAEHVAAIRQLQLDVAFITGTMERVDCETEHLWSEGVFVVLPSRHRLIMKEQVDWKDLSNECFIVSDGAPGPEIHDFLVRRLSGLGYHPEIQAQYVGRDVLLSLVAIGYGLTLTSEATIRLQIPGIIYRPIANEVLPFSAVWSPRNDNPACRRLLSLARSMARSRAASLNSPISTAPQFASPSQNPDLSL